MRVWFPREGLLERSEVRVKIWVCKRCACEKVKEREGGEEGALELKEVRTWKFFRGRRGEEK